MSMILPTTPVGVEHRDVSALEWGALDRAIEGIQTLCPTPHEGTQHASGVLVEGGPEHRRHRQNDMPIDDPLVQDVTDLADPVVHIHFGTA